jgi:hypothetical protein
MAKISNRKFKNILRSTFIFKHKRTPELGNDFVNHIYDTIPEDFNYNKKSKKVLVKLGFASLITALIIYSMISIFNKQVRTKEEDSFKPTKIVILDYPSFKPTKIVEITPADKIGKDLR